MPLYESKNTEIKMYKSSKRKQLPQRNKSMTSICPAKTKVGEPNLILIRIFCFESL